jgi:predicted RNA-binding Zn ribbon-like protein
MSEIDFTLLGDAIWLDFVNTARGRTDPAPDLLHDADAVARWVLAQRLHLDGDTPRLEDALHLRERLTELAEALHQKLQPPAGAIEAINEHLAHSQGCHQLTRVSGAWQLRFSPVQRPAVLQAIARSAAASLADPLLSVRRCAGVNCSLYFSDDSSNQSRMWCSAAICGRDVRVERRRGLLR